jgi:inner membrane protein
VIAPGHIGITLLLCAPFAYAFTAPEGNQGVSLWVWLALVLTLLPDVDVFLPGFVHRGVTHSLSAAAVLGVVVAAAGWASVSSAEARARRAAVGFAVGAGSVLSHLLGDVITPMGIRPFLPANRTMYTLDLVYARNVEANLALFVVGVATFWTVQRRSAIRADEAGTVRKTARETPDEPLAESAFDGDEEVARGIVPLRWR